MITKRPNMTTKKVLMGKGYAALLPPNTVKT